MMDGFWLLPYRSTFRFMRVGRASGLETGEIDGITGGSVSRNQDTAVYETASLDYEGTLDVGTDLVRAYHEAADPLGDARRSVCLGTWECSTPSRNISGADSSGTAALYGRLHSLEKADFDGPYVVPAGTNPVDAARKICEDAGLEVVSDPSDYVLTADWVFGVAGDQDGPDSKLAAVNKLLAVAGFRAATTDAWGRVLFRRYVEPAARPVDAELREGEGCRLLVELTDELDDYDAVNLVIVDYTCQGDSVRGSAVDDDPESPWSTVSTGRTVAKRYQVSDLPGGKNLVSGGSWLIMGDGTHEGGTWRQSGSGGSLSAVEVTGCPIRGVERGVRIARSGSGEIGFCQDKVSLAKGKRYTESLYLRADTRCQVRIQPIWRGEDHASTEVIDLEPGWHRLTMTAAASMDGEYSLGYAYLAASSPEGSSCTVCMVRVEEGPEPTPFAIEAANVKARDLLDTECSVISRQVLSMTFRDDMDVYSAVTLDLPTAGIGPCRSYVRTLSMELKPGCPIKAEVRRFLRGSES